MLSGVYQDKKTTAEIVLRFDGCGVLQPPAGHRLVGGQSLSWARYVGGDPRGDWEEVEL